jgi:phage-related protein/archaellum component FlaC
VANVNANVNVIVNTKQAQSQIASFQSTINAFNKSVVTSSSAAVAQQAALNKALMDGAVASRMFTARMIPVTSSVDSFTQSLEKGKFSLGQYTRLAGSQLPGMSRIFKKEFNTIQQVAESNVRRLQTQFTAAGTAANGMNRAIALTPTSLNNMAAAQSIANQKAMIFNRLMRDGSTSLLNWGKNTQWAGRQLMVGFTIPLTIFAGVAAKTFKDLEAQAINFKKVYGDIFTTEIEVEKNLSAVKELSLELTKYGIAVKDTMELAGIAAQSGMRGADLTAATVQATRLAVLGQMEQAEAMKTVISLQTAFQQSNDELAESVDFLNIIENQTVLSLQDVAGAIPRVAPVIQGLGGDVKDLAVLLVAMREGGVSAAEGANALKNSLGRLINPTTQAQAMAAKFGINLMKIVKDSKGEVMPMLLELSTAMKGLGGLQQQQLLSTVFGKFQYARIGALFKNLQDDTSQARRAMELMEMSAEDLAATSEKELAVVEDAISTKFTAAMERAKVAIAPIGELFLKAVTPLLEGISKVFEKFDSLPDNVKNTIGIVIGIIGGIVPVGLMVIGLLGNLVANGLKFLNTLRKLFAQLTGMGSKFSEMAIGEQEAALAANSLEGNVDALTRTMLLQQEAVQTLITLYGNLAGAAAGAAAAMPTGFGGVGSVARGASPFGSMMGPAPDFRGFNEGVVSVVPGAGNKDTVPAMLTPGESVITKEATQKYGALIAAMNAGTIQGFSNGIPNRSDLTFAPAEYNYRGGSATQEKIDLMGQKYAQAGGRAEDFATALERASQKVNENGTQLSVSMKSVVDELDAMGASLGLRPGEAPREASGRRLQAAHLTDPIPYENIPASQLQSPAGLARQLGESIFPGTTTGTSMLTAGVSDTLNQLLKQKGRNAGATFDQFREGWGDNKQQLMPAARRQDPSLLQDATSVNELENLSDAIQNKAIEVAEGQGKQKVQDADLAAATEAIVRARREEVESSIQLSAQEREARLKAIQAIESAASDFGEIRQNVPKADLERELAPGGRLVQEGRYSVPDPNDPRNQEDMRRLGIDPQEYAALPVSVRGVARDESRPNYTGKRPAAELTDAQKRVLQETQEGAVDQALESAEDALDQELGQGARAAIDAASPAQEGARAVDSYVDGMAQGVEQNSAQVAALGSNTGETYDESVKRAIREGEGSVPPPPPPTGRSRSAAGGDEPQSRRPTPQENEQEVKAKIMEQVSVEAQKEALSFKGSIKRIFAETGNAFKVFPRLTSELIRNFEGPLVEIKKMLGQLAAPYVNPIIAAYQKSKKAIIDTATKIGTNIKEAVDSAITKVKAVPGKIMGGITTAIDATKQAFQSVGSKIKTGIDAAYQSVKGAADTIKSVMDKAKGIWADRATYFNNAKEAVTKGIDAAKGAITTGITNVRETLSSSFKRLKDSADVSKFALREGTLAGAARPFVPDNVAQEVKSITDSIKDSVNNIKTNITETATKVSDSAKAAAAALREGDLKTAIRAMTPDKIANAFNAAVKPVKDAATFLADKVSKAATNIATKVGEAASAISGKLGEFKTTIIETGQKFANAVTVAKDALAMGDLKTALRSLTPDKLAQALGKAQTRFRDTVSAARERVGAAAITARATGRTAVEALLARDIKTFIKALTPDKVQQAVSKLATKISEAASQAYTKVIEGIKNLPGQIKDAFNSFKTTVTETAKSIFTTVKTTLVDAFNSAKESLKTGFEDLKRSVVETAKDVKQKLSGAFDKVKRDLTTEFDRIKGVFRRSAPEIKQAMDQANQGNRGAIRQAGADLANSIRQVGVAVKQAGKSLIPMMGGALGAGVQKASMGLSGLAMAASFAGGEIGEMAQKFMPVSMGLMAVSMMLPLFKSKLGLAMIAVGAVTALYIKSRQDLDKLATSAMEAGASLGGFANRMQSMGEATGYKFAAERAQDRMMRLSDEDREAMSEFSDYFEGERGQKFLNDLKKLSKPDRYSEVAKMISLAIADGMDPKTAKAYGMSIAKYLNDAIMGQRLKSDFAAGKFEDGINGMINAIDIIAERQDRLDEIVNTSPQNVGQSAAARALANRTGIGRLDTQKSMFAEGLAVTGAGAAAGVAAQRTARGAVAARQSLAARAAQTPPRTFAVGGSGVAQQVAGRQGAQTAGGIAARAGATTALRVGAGAAIGLGGGAKMGAAMGAILGPKGMIAGAIIGTAAAAFVAWKQYNKQVEILNSNLGTAATIIGSTVQTLGEVRNAEESLLLMRQEGKISAEEYANELSRLKDIEQRATASLGSVIDTMMMGGMVDQGALQAAMKNQLVVAGFEGDLAEAVTGIVNAKDVAKSLFPEEDFDAVMADAGKRDVIRAVMTETLAGITPENAAEKLADVQSQWAQVADKLLKASEDGLTSEEMQAVLIGESAGRALRDGLLRGAEDGMTTGDGGIQGITEDAYRSGVEEARRALAGEEVGPGTRIVREEDGFVEVETDAGRFTATERDSKTSGSTGALLADAKPTDRGGFTNVAARFNDEIDKMFGDTTFTDLDKGFIEEYRNRLDVPMEEFLSTVASSTMGAGKTFRENMQKALADPESFDWMQFEGMGLGDTPEQIQESLQSIIDRALVNIEQEDIQVEFLGNLVDVAQRKMAEWAEGQGTDLLAGKAISPEQFTAGIAEAGAVLGEERILKMLEEDEQGLMALIDLIEALQTEAMQGISMEFAVNTVFDGQQSPETALANLQRDFGGLGETFGAQTQSIIDQLVGKQDALVNLGNIGSFEDFFDDKGKAKGTLEEIQKLEVRIDSLATKYGVSKDKIKSWWKDSESIAKKSISNQGKELKKFGDDINALANISGEGDEAGPLTRLGIDLENIDIETIERFGPAAETLAEYWSVIENLNPKIDMSAYVDFLTLQNGEPLSVKDSMKNVQKLNQLFADLEGAEDQKTQKTLLFQLFAEKDGEPVSSDQINKAYDDLVSEFDEGTILNLPPDILEKAIQFKVDAQGFKESALAFREAAQAAFLGGDSTGGALLINQAIALERAAAAADRSSSLAVASATTGQGPSKSDNKGGGSKGGGGDKSIIEQLKESVNNLKKMSKLVTSAIAGQKPAFKNFIAGPFAMEFIEYLKGQGEKAVKELGNNAKKFKQAYRLFVKERALELKMALAVEQQGYKDELKIAQQRSRFMSGFGGSMAQRESVTGRFGEENMELFLQLDAMTKAQRKAEGLQKTYLQLKKNRDILIEQAPRMAAIDQMNSFRDSVKSANEGFTLFNSLVARGFSPAFAQKLIELGVGMELLKDNSAEAKQEFAELVAEARKLEGIESAQNVAVNISAGREDLLATYRIMMMFPGITQESIDAMKGLGVTAGSTADTMKTAFNGVKTAAAIAKMAMDAFARNSLVIDTAVSGLQRQIERINRIEIRPLEQQIKTIEGGIKAIDKVIKGIQKTIKPIEKEVKDFEKTVKSLEKEIKVYDKQIKDIQKTLKPLEKENEALREVEKEINDEFAKREKALDQIEKINSRIAAQQRSQLSMAKAIAEGDIYAVAAAMQQYRAEQAQMNAEQTRESLREGNERRREEITKKIEENERQIKNTNEQIESIQERIEAIQERIEGIQEQIEQRTERIADLNEQIADLQENIADEQERIADLQERIEASKEKQLALEEKIYKLQLLRSMLDTAKSIREAAAEGDTELVRLLQAEQNVNLELSKGENFGDLGINAAPILSLGTESVNPSIIAESIKNGIDAAFLIALDKMGIIADNWVNTGVQHIDRFKDIFTQLSNLSEDELGKLPSSIQGLLSAINEGSLKFPSTAEELRAALVAYGVTGSDLMQTMLASEGLGIIKKVDEVGETAQNEVKTAGKEGKKTIDAEAEAIGKSAANLGKKVAAAEKEFEKGNITFRQAALRILGAMADAIGSAAISKVDTGGFNNALTEIANSLRTGIGQFSTALSTTLDSILTIGNRFKDNIETVQEITDSFTGIMDLVSEQFGTTLETVSVEFGEILDNVSTRFGEFGDSFNSAFADLMTRLAGNFEGILNTNLGTITNAVGTLADTQNGLPAQLATILQQFRDFIGSIGNGLSVINSFLQNAMGILQVAIAAAKTAADAAMSAANAANDAAGRASESARIARESFGFGGYVQKMAMGGKAKKYGNGSFVPGNGLTDKVPALLMPGEFVVRKSVAQAYGPELMNLNSQVFPKMNKPSFEEMLGRNFAMPKYNVETETNIKFNSNVRNNTSFAPVYNTYDMDFAINGGNASADEIANKVMFKIKQVQNQGLRGNRGY